MRRKSRCSGWSPARWGGPALAAAVWILCGLGGAACSSSGGTSHDGGPGGGGAGGTDAAADRAVGDAGADAGGTTCQQIRLCAFSCTDEACVDTCAQRGSAAAQAAFQNVRSCTRAAAPDGGGCTSVGDPSYRNCLCLAQCLESPPCAATLDPCLGNLDDVICDGCA